MEKKEEEKMMYYECCVCEEDFTSEQLHEYRGKFICDSCWNDLIQEINQKQQQTSHTHCKECGKSFKDNIMKPFPSDSSEYCYTCYWRVLASGNERHDRYACYGCNKTFFTAEPNWFEGKRYCFECFQRLEKEQKKHYENLFWENIRFYGFDYTFRWRSYTASSTSTYSISKEVQEAFKILGLQTSATPQEVKKAFKHKALVTHPDVGGNHTDMVVLNKAKETCLNYVERKHRR